MSSRNLTAVEGLRFPLLPWNFRLSLCKSLDANMLVVGVFFSHSLHFLTSKFLKKTEQSEIAVGEVFCIE